MKGKLVLISKGIVASHARQTRLEGFFSGSVQVKILVKEHSLVSESVVKWQGIVVMYQRW
eukprot:scaffold171616_cov12-Tisochrysis_lutea.AAC.1